VRFRIAYATHAELAADVKQMAHGGVLVRDPAAAQLAFDTPVVLELVMPDKSTLVSGGKVLQALAGLGVAVTIEPHVVEQARKLVEGAPKAPMNAMATPAVATEPEPEPEPVSRTELSRAQKIHLALHGTRDQRNAMLRDRDRGLHSFVLKNPGITVDDVLAIAKNAMMGAEMYKQIAERADWFQRPQIALALARNHKVPAEIAIRALAHVSPDALRQLAKGAGAPPHVVQAARKRVVGP